MTNVHFLLALSVDNQKEKVVRINIMIINGKSLKSFIKCMTLYDIVAKKSSGRWLLLALDSCSILVCVGRGRGRGMRASSGRLRSQKGTFLGIIYIKGKGFHLLTNYSIKDIKGLLKGPKTAQQTQFMALKKLTKPHSWFSSSFLLGRSCS